MTMDKNIFFLGNGFTNQEWGDSLHRTRVVFDTRNASHFSKLDINKLESSFHDKALMAFATQLEEVIATELGLKDKYSRPSSLLSFNTNFSFNHILKYKEYNDGGTDVLAWSPVAILISGKEIIVHIRNEDGSSEEIAF